MCLRYAHAHIPLIRQISDYIKVRTTPTVRRFAAAVCKMPILQPRIEYKGEA